MTAPKASNPPIKKCSPREELFCRAVANGSTYTAAFREFWNHPDWADKAAAHEAHRISKRPHVVERIEQFRKQATRIVLLSMNQRLGFLADVVRNKKAPLRDRIRATESYSRLAGDAAPEHHILTGQDGGPVEVETTITPALSRREKIAALKQAAAKT